MRFGPWEIVAILAVVLIIFGVGKLPQAMGQLGKGIRNFKKAATGEDADEKSGSKKEGVAAKDSENKNASS